MDVTSYILAKKYIDELLENQGSGQIGQEYVDNKIAELVNSAPEMLDTIGELAKAFQDNEEVIDTINKAINEKVSKEDGKGLSSNDFTDELLEKVNNIENLSAKDWDQNDENHPEYIKNRPFGETGEFEEIELFNQNVAFRATGPNNEVLVAQVLSGCPILANGITYKIIIGTYEYVGQKSANDDSSGFGNESLLIGPPIQEGEPFYCLSSGGFGIFSLDSSFFTETNLNIIIYQMKPIINSLPRKFIEEYSAGYKANIQNYEYDGQIYNSNFGAEIFNDEGNKAIGEYSHAEGNQTKVIGAGAHAEGGLTEAIGSRAHAEGSSTQAIGEYSHAEGNQTKAIGAGAHAEGMGTEATYNSCHAEGWYTIANTPFLHVQGAFNIPEEDPLLFSCGYYVAQTVTYEEDEEVYVYDSCPSLNRTTGIFTAGNSHKKSVKELKVNDYFSMSDYSNSVIENYKCLYVEKVVASDPDTNATTYSFVIRQLTASPRNTQPGKYLHIVGNGNTDKRSNAHTIEADGNAWFAGDVYTGSTSGTNKDEGSKKLATEEYIDIRVPAWTAEDEGKVLKIVNGTPTWV